MTVLNFLRHLVVKISLGRELQTTAARRTNTAVGYFFLTLILSTRLSLGNLIKSAYLFCSTVLRRILGYD
jgi:hypothetical protein